jgi:hypothetical protein
MAVSHICPLLAKQQGGFAYSLVRKAVELYVALLSNELGISKE